MTDLTKEFALNSIDHDELLHFLSLYYGTAWRTKEQDKSLAAEIALPEDFQVALRIRYRQGRITKVFRGPLLRKQRDLDALLEAMRVNCRDPAIKGFGRGLLMVSRPVRGSYRSKSVPLQILPPTDELPHPPFLHAQHPVLIEFPMRSWERDDLRLWRRYKCLMEWAWVLNTLLHVGVRAEGPRPHSAWVLNPTDRSHFYAQELFPPFLGNAVLATFSAKGQDMPIAPAATYYADWHVRARANLSQDELILPDNLDQALAKFDALQGLERHRFLSAAAIVYIATASWDLSISSSFIATVQAIECVAQELPRSSRRWLFWRRAIGPSRRFRQICEAHGAEAGVDDKTLQRLYAIRSGIVHGESLFDVDRHPWGIGMAGSVLGLDDLDAAGAAARLAKSVLRDWLISR
jgi:hypothetical protein